MNSQKSIEVRSSNFTLVLNSSNAINSGGYYNSFQYNFINGGFQVLNDSEICLTQLTIPYSWSNVNSIFYNNASFQYRWIVGSTPTTFTINLPTGFYSLTQINQYLQSQMIANGTYLIDSGGNFVYYISITSNPTYYTNQIVCFPVPTSLPSGYTQPSGFAGYPSIASTPQLVILNNNFGSLIGYTDGSYPPVVQSTSYSTLGNTLPNGSPVNSVIVRCSLVFNKVVNPTDIIDSFPISGSFGSNLNYIPNFEKMVKIKKGTYSSLVISLFDQNLNPLPSIDPNVLINLLIRMPDI